MNLLANKKLLISLCLLAVAAGYGSARLAHPPAGPGSVQNATVLDFPRPLPVIELIDSSGHAFRNEHLLNQWSLLFFGFTHCPDVCPTTLALLRDTVARIKARDAEVAPRVYLISVDPQRDTPDKLAAYVAFFDPDFVGVTGTEMAIDDFTRTVGVARNQVLLDDGQYTIDHTSAIFIVNPAGETAAISSSPHTPKVLANDVLAIMRDY